MGLIRSTQSAERPAPVQASLDHPDPGPRRLAARLLGEEPGSEPRLLAHLASEADVSVREACLLALVRLGTPEAAEGLARLMTAEDAALRNAALESLASMPGESAELLDSLAQSADPDVRIFGALLAGELPQPWIEDWLIDLMSADEDPNVCAAVAEVLAESGSARCLPALQALPGRFPDEPFLQFVAATVQARLGTALP